MIKTLLRVSFPDGLGPRDALVFAQACFISFRFFPVASIFSPPDLFFGVGGGVCVWFGLGGVLGDRPVFL